MKFSILLALALSYTTLSSAQGQNFRPANADKAEQLTKEFAKLTKDSPCENNAQACVEDQFAQCVGGKFQLNSCGGGELKCVVLPLVNKPGTSITCSTEADRLARLADARGENKGNGNDGKAPGNGKENDVKVPDNENDGKAPGNGKENDVKVPDNENDGKAPDNENDGKAPDNENDGKAPPDNENDGKAPDNENDGKAPDNENDGKAPGNGKENDGKAPGNGKENDGKAPGNGKDGKDGKLPPDNNLCKCPPPNNDDGNGDDNDNEDDNGDNNDNEDGNGDNNDNEDGNGDNNDNEDGNGDNNDNEDGNGDNNDNEDGNGDNNDNEDGNGDNNDNEDGNGNDNENDNKDGEDGKAPTDGEDGKAPSGNDKLKTPPANGDGNLADLRKQNVADAKALQEKFDALKPEDNCNDNEVACVDNKFAQCSGGKFALTECASGTTCAALPLVLKRGTTVACTTEADRDARLKQAESNAK